MDRGQEDARKVLGPILGCSVQSCSPSAPRHVCSYNICALILRVQSKAAQSDKPATYKMKVTDQICSKLRGCSEQELPRGGSIAFLATSDVRYLSHTGILVM